MKLSARIAAMAATSFIGAAAWTAASAQAIPAGTVYTFHSKSDGSCPALDWHLVSGENNSISGMISWNGMKSMARATGSIGPDRTFTLNLKETGGHHNTATVTGQARSDGFLVAEIKGPHVDCKGIVVPIWRPGTQSGGGG